MQRPSLRSLAAVVGAILLLGACGGGGPSSTSAASAAPAASAAASAASGGSALFGGDVCTALTGAEVAAASWPQGAATFSSTDTQVDADTGKAVVCQYLVTFGDNPSTVAVAVSILSSSAWDNRQKDSLVKPAVALPGVGGEAWVVYPVPGMTEVYVNTPHGAFKVGCPVEANATAFAKLAAPRA